jgi:anti-anti-sigma factor
MEAKISRDGEIWVVHLKGFLDFESVAPFRQTCLQHLRDKKVIFNLGDLNFVGSSGITTFVETIKELKDGAEQIPKFCGLSAEFRRVFVANELEKVEVYEDVNGAAAAFINPELAQLDWADEILGLDATEIDELGGTEGLENPMTHEPVFQVEESWIEEGAIDANVEGDDSDLLTK